MANQSVASGILTDYNGNPFLPRTVTSQVFKEDGTNLNNIVWPVPNGGTGKNSHTTNSVLVGNSSSTIKNIASANGAFYATSANGEPKFGTLPVAQGGTGITSNPSLLVNLESTTADTVFEATPRPGVTGKLGIANGGTGATTAAGARTNLGVLSADDTYQYSTPRAANSVLAGPTSGASASATFRALVAADIPVLTTSHLPSIPDTKLPTIPISKGGTGATSITANRVLFASGNAITASSHSIDSTKLAINTSQGVTNYNFCVNGSSYFHNGAVNFAGGHLYLRGSSASSSTANTTQLIFGTESAQHIALSANDNALILNPDAATVTNQIVLYLNQASVFPSGLQIGGKLILENEIYGSLDDMNAISSPVEGQVFFVLN